MAPEQGQRLRCPFGAQLWRDGTQPGGTARQIGGTADRPVTGGNHRLMRTQHRIARPARDRTDILPGQMRGQQRQHPLPANRARQGHVSQHQCCGLLARKLFQRIRQHLRRLGNWRSNLWF